MLRHLDAYSNHLPPPLFVSVAPSMPLPVSISMNRASSALPSSPIVLEKAPLHHSHPDDPSTLLGPSAQPAVATSTTVAPAHMLRVVVSPEYLPPQTLLPPLATSAASTANDTRSTVQAILFLFVSSNHCNAKVVRQRCLLLWLVTTITAPAITPSATSINWVSSAATFFSIDLLTIACRRCLLECVRRRVMQSLASNPNCSETAAKDATEGVWNICYNDTEPFDTVP
ncbi:hypothetical protein SASPL_138057 [Salvia splendens]|uniref:Mitochondrial inner membrane protease ATP23 n=1 Tax=Salvia splendens TaxID=180675 RepID=A0A8X8WW62_SALSN|nr:hypothetical protein SASPL_138057 [Salvia splendens]